MSFVFRDCISVESGRFDLGRSGLCGWRNDDLAEATAPRRRDCAAEIDDALVSRSGAVSRLARCLAATPLTRPSTHCLCPRCGAPLGAVSGALKACVIRYWNRKKKALDYIVLVTTDQRLNGAWIVRHYEERPEIEQDYEQMKSGGWQLQKLSSTRYSEIVFYITTV